MAEMERKYTADQLPLTVDGRAQKVESWYIATGTVTDQQNPGRPKTAAMNFTCTVETGSDGQLSSTLTEFEPQQ